MRPRRPARVVERPLNFTVRRQVMRPIRVSVLFGGLVLSAAVAYALPAKPHYAFQGTNGRALLAATAAFGLIFGALSTAGTFLALRSVPPERLSYRTALAIALIYFTVCFLTNLIPIHTTVILDGHPLNPGFYVGIAALLLLMCGVVPYLIAFFVRSRLGRGA